MLPSFMNFVNVILNFYKMRQVYKNGFQWISKKLYRLHWQKSMTIDISVVEIFNEEWNMFFRRLLMKVLKKYGS